MCKKDTGGGSGGNFGGGTGGGGSGGGPSKARTPEAGQFDSFVCEAMMATLEEVKTEKVWLADTGSSHHLVGKTTGMLDIEPCKKGTKMNQVQGEVEVH